MLFLDDVIDNQKGQDLEVDEPDNHIASRDNDNFQAQSNVQELGFDLETMEKIMMEDTWITTMELDYNNFSLCCENSNKINEKLDFSDASCT